VARGAYVRKMSTWVEIKKKVRKNAWKIVSIVSILFIVIMLVFTALGGASLSLLPATKRMGAVNLFKS